jgi:hypothetical protein
MGNRQLPAWVDAAICTMEVETLRQQLISRWREIEIDVLPALAALSDIGKQLVFEQAFAATLFDYSITRQAQKDLRDLHGRIACCATELASLLQQTTDLSESHGMVTGIPGLWDTLDSAAQRWLHWYGVMKAHGHLQDFLRVAKGQSRPGPAWSDLIEELADRIDADEIESFLDPVIESRKREADASRATQQSISLLIHPDIPQKFMLPDQAMATLISVLFNVEVSSPAIKQMRFRDRKRR